MTKQRLFFALRVAAWAAVAGCVVVFLLKIDRNQVFHAFQGADLKLALAAALLVIPGIALQGLRWSSLVKGLRSIPRSIPVAAVFVGQAASAFLPMRAGEAVRAELLSRATGIGRATALGTVALDHSVNGVVMFAFAAVLPALLPVPRWVAIVAWAGMAGAIALVLTLLWLAKHPESVPSGRIAHAVAHARSGLMGARNPRAVAEAAMFSAMAWSVEIGVITLALAACHGSALRRERRAGDPLSTRVAGQLRAGRGNGPGRLWRRRGECGGLRHRAARHAAVAHAHRGGPGTRHVPQGGACRTR